jgi:hypothetical protein
MGNIFKILSQVFSIFIFVIFCCVISPNLAIAAPIKLASVDFTKQEAIAVRVNRRMDIRAN